MLIDRKFTQESKDPYEGIKFVERVSKINNADGSLVAEIKNVLVPDSWSQVAVDIIAQKYFRKAGVPPATRTIPEENMPDWLAAREPDHDKSGSQPIGNRNSSETPATQVFDRMV